MAIRIVQGLIGAPVGQGESVQRGAPNPQAPIAPSSQTSAQLQQHQSARISQFAGHVSSQAVSQADAAVKTLRSFSASRKREKMLKEFEAFTLVEQIALSLLSEEDGATEAHAELASTMARAYFFP